MLENLVNQVIGKEEKKEDLGKKFLEALTLDSVRASDLTQATPMVSLHSSPGKQRSRGRACSLGSGPQPLLKSLRACRGQPLQQPQQP